MQYMICKKSFATGYVCNALYDMKISLTTGYASNAIYDMQISLTTGYAQEMQYMICKYLQLQDMHK